MESFSLMESSSLAAVVNSIDRSTENRAPNRCLPFDGTVIEWSLNELGSLNDLAVGPHNLHILPGYLDGQMPYVPGASGYRVFTSKIVHHQTTHDFIVHDRIHLPTIYLYSVFYPFTIVRHKNMGP